MLFNDIWKSATKLLIFGYYILTCLSLYDVNNEHMYKKKYVREKEISSRERNTVQKAIYI